MYQSVFFYSNRLNVIQRKLCVAYVALEKKNQGVHKCTIKYFYPINFNGSLTRPTFLVLHAINVGASNFLIAY